MDSRRWRRANVLAVDDQPANLITLDAVLSSEFEVIRASSGEQALEILALRDDIDVILMDVQMPGMDGFEAAARVKQMPGRSDIPIVFITAVFHEDPFIKQGYDVGAVDYFTKPFNPEILKLKVAIYASFHQKVDLLNEWERQIQTSGELLQAGRKFAVMLENMPIAVVVMDGKGTMRSVGSEHIHPGLDWWDADGYLRPGISSAVEHVIAKGEPACDTVEVRGIDGAFRSIFCTASSLRARDGSPSGIVLIVRDVTECNRAQQELERRIAGLAVIPA
jgi:CheY-like chemotaxis protein